MKVALAMKGGVSLAVWIGGAVAELDVLRRIRIVRGRSRETPDAYFIAPTGGDLSTNLLKRADLYAKAMVARQYDRIQFDVLAGASAGGLNGVLYGVAQTAGSDVDDLLEVWTTHGAIGKLLHRGGFGRVNSVLSGDYFWRGVTEAIKGFYGEGQTNPNHRAMDLSLHLSATIKDPDYRATLASREGRGHFHFVSWVKDDRSTRGRDIPTAAGSTSDDGMASVARLAYAARTTSSFPGAFEPALISSRPAANEDVADPDEVDMRFAFSAHRSDRPFRVIDGGVLDNIPIDRVIRAMRDRVPDQRSTRLVLYLDPSPDSTKLNATRSSAVSAPKTATAFERTEMLPTPALGNKLSRFRDTVLAGIKMRGISESGPQEVSEVQRLRRALFSRAGRMLAYGGSLPEDGAQLNNVLEGMLIGYEKFRVSWDNNFLSEILTAPDLWQLGSRLQTRKEHKALAPEQLQKIDGELQRLYVTEIDHVTQVKLRKGSRAALDASYAAIDWLRRLERVVFLDPVRHAEANAPLRVARKKAREAASEALLKFEERVDAMLTSFGEKRELAPPVKIVTVAQEWLTAEEVQSDDSPIWQALDVAVQNLREASRLLGDAAPPPWRMFAESKATPYHLAPFTAASGIPDPTFAIRFDAITGGESVQFDAITGRESIQFGQKFTLLRAAQLGEVAESWLRLPKSEFTEILDEQNAPIPKSLDDRAKLAGSSLWNFGAFLSEDWRRNDWWWGRLDAAAGIVRILDRIPVHGPQPENLAAQPSPTNVQGDTPERQDHTVRDKRQNKARDLVLLQSNESTDRTTPVQVTNEGDVIARHMSGGAQSLSNLREGYVVGIVSRLARVAVRALLGGQRTLPRVFLMFFLPPVLVFAPILAAPIRVVFMVTGVALALQLILVSNPIDAAPDRIALLIGGAIAVHGLYRVIQGQYRRSILNCKRTDLMIPLRDRSRRAAQTSILQITLAIAALAGAMTLFLVTSSNPAIAWAFLATSVALSTVASRTAKKLPARGARLRPNLIWGGIASVLATAFAVSTESAKLNEWWSAPLAGALCAAFITVALSVGWLRVPLFVLVMVATPAIVFLVVWLVNSLLPVNVLFSTAVAAGTLAWIVGAQVFWWTSSGWHCYVDGDDKPRSSPIPKEDLADPDQNLSSRASVATESSGISGSPPRQ